jgi:hypothetical protein
MDAKGACAGQKHLTIPTYTHQPARQLPPLFDYQRSLYPDTLDDILGGIGQCMRTELNLENKEVRGELDSA